jgi:hypothetical protein
MLTIRSPKIDPSRGPEMSCFSQAEMSIHENSYPKPPPCLMARDRFVGPISLKPPEAGPQ